MKINGGSTGPARPDASREARGSVAEKAEQDAKPATSRVDTVEISDAGRAKAAGSVASGDVRGTRLQDIRQRILRGAYDTDEVVAEVARRILDRGELRPASPAKTR